MKKILLLICLIIIVSCGNNKTSENIDSNSEVYITYDSNGAESGTVPLIKSSYNISENIQISENTGNLSKKDYVFDGWNTNKDGSGTYFSPNESVKIENNLYLYANWKPLEIAAKVETNIKFIRPLQIDSNKYHILYLKDGVFTLSEQIYEDIIDPYVTEKDAFRLIDWTTEKMRGFQIYEEHKYNSNYIPVKLNNKFGFVDLRNEFKLVIQPLYDEVHPFKDGFAAIKLNEKWGYIDLQGKIVIETQYDYVFDFFNGLSVVANGSDLYEDANYGIIDTSGTTVLDPDIENSFEYICSFYSPMIAKGEVKNGSLVVIDRSGKIIIDNIMEYYGRGGSTDPAYYFGDNGLVTMIVSEDGSYSSSKINLFGAFNNKGEWVISPQPSDSDEIEYLADLESAESDQLIVYKSKENGLYGYTDKNREWVIQPKYNYANNFVKDKALVDMDGKTGIIDRSGNWILEPSLERVTTDFFDNRNDGLFQAKLLDKWGIIDYNGNWLVEPKYTSIEMPHDINDPIIVETDDFKGIISSTGQEIYRFNDGERAIPFKNGISFIYKPIGDIDYNTGLQKFSVTPISEDGKALFENVFYEYIEQSLL